MLRTSLIAASAATLVACASTEVELPWPYREDIPSDAAFIFRFHPGLLSYEFTDSTANGQLWLSWLPATDSLPFIGYTCFGFTPRVPGDSVGRFVFIARDLNTGYLERTTTAGVDTTLGSLLSGLEGSRGTYLLHQSGDLDLTWSNGQQVRFFDPAATIRLLNDTLSANVTLRANADSVSVSWSVAWVLSSC